MKAALLFSAFGALSFSIASLVDTQEPLSVSPTTKNVMINFDDIPTSTNGTGTLPTIYQNLSFTNLTLLNPASALSANLLRNPHELHCATSSPNALFSANYQTYNPHQSFKIEPPLISSIYLNTTLATSLNDPIAFNLLGFSLGPLGFAPAHPHEVKLHLRLYYAHPDGDEEVGWSVYILYAPGENAGRKFNFGDGSGFPDFGKRINRVDVWGISASGWNRHGSPGGGSNWAWCLDDLEVEWIYRDDDVLIPPGGVGGELVLDLR